VLSAGEETALVAAAKQWVLDNYPYRRTVLTQIAAQELGIAPDRIAMIMGDTSVVPYDSSTSASRSTVFMGNALMKACGDIKLQIRRMASEMFQVAEDTIALEGGQVRLPGRDLSYAELLKAWSDRRAAK